MKHEDFYSTYKELKLGLFCWTKLKGMIFTLPIRNWNELYQRTIDGGHGIFTLPIRNWNVYAQKPTKQSQLNFYSTYKELKLCCYRLEDKDKLYFYSTYKELKHCLKIYLSFVIILIFTLPIRNWNVLMNSSHIL